jgi:hypothetical protein
MMATLQKPTGFSEPVYHESEVEIVGFVYGASLDANGYGRSGDCALAVVHPVGGGYLQSVPVHWLKVASPAMAEDRVALVAAEHGVG